MALYITPPTPNFMLGSSNSGVDCTSQVLNSSPAVYQDLVSYLL